MKLLQTTFIIELPRYEESSFLTCTYDNILYFFYWQGVGESIGMYGDHTSDLHGFSDSGGVPRFSLHHK